MDTRASITSRRIWLMQWRAQLPYLNPMEHLWESWVRFVQSGKPNNIDVYFWKHYKWYWDNVSGTVVNDLNTSMFRICEVGFGHFGYLIIYR